MTHLTHKRNTIPKSRARNSGSPNAEGTPTVALSTALISNKGSDKPVAVSTANSQTAPSALETLKATTGCKTSTAAFTVFRQVMTLEHALIEHAPDDRSTESMRSALAMLDELEPRTGTEALLAAQMIGTQRLAMTFLQRAVVDGQTFDGVNANVVRATRLMRLFNEQLDAMAKLKGKSGQQHVVVEHVTVAAGGQAIVGAVMPRDDRDQGRDAK